MALPIACATAEVVRRSAWSSFGYQNQGDFTRERLQHHPRWMHDQVRFHAVLEKYPRLKEAVCGLDGGVPLGQVASVQIGRVATEETLASWIDRARALPLNELRAAVAEARASSPEAGLEVPRSTGRSIAEEEEESEESRVLLRRIIPPDVRLIFDSGFELHRNLEGRETSLSGFVQALIQRVFPYSQSQSDLFALLVNKARLK